MTYLYVVSIPIAGQTFYADYVQSYRHVRPNLSSILPGDNLQNDQFQGAPFVAFSGQHFLLRLVNQRQRPKPKPARTMLAALGRLAEGISADRFATFFPWQISLALGRDFRRGKGTTIEPQHFVVAQNRRQRRQPNLPGQKDQDANLRFVLRQEGGKLRKGRLRFSAQDRMTEIPDQHLATPADDPVNLVTRELRVPLPGKAGELFQLLRPGGGVDARGLKKAFRRAGAGPD